MKKLHVLLPIICLFWPSAAFASELETQLFRSCTEQSSSSPSQCSCKAKKWASKRVQSVEQPSTFMRIGEHHLERLKQEWYGPELMSSQRLDGEQAILAMLGMNISVSCLQEEYPVFESRVHLD